MATVSGMIGNIQVRKVFRRKPEELVDELKLHLEFNVVEADKFDLVKIYKTNNQVYEPDEATNESYPLRFVSHNRKEEVWFSTNEPEITGKLLELMGFNPSAYGKGAVIKK